MASARCGHCSIAAAAEEERRGRGRGEEEERKRRGREEEEEDGGKTAAARELIRCTITAGSDIEPAVMPLLLPVLTMIRQ